MEKRLWKFTDKYGTFVSPGAGKINSLYFPLCNERIMSSVTPDLHGDCKTADSSFLLEPVSRIWLTTSRASRNFWVCTDKNTPWSATGVSKNLKQIKEDTFNFQAGLLWQKVMRENRALGIRAEILSFVPALDYPVEIMQVTLINISRKKIKCIPVAAIPMFCRGSLNLRDHRHVTSLLQRVSVDKFGVVATPTLSFDESGHRPNKDHYFVLGWDQKCSAPAHIYPTQEGFCGDAGDLEAPEVLFENILPEKTCIQGKEPMGALRFKAIELAPRKSVTYTVVMGVTSDRQEIDKIIVNLNTLMKVDIAFKATQNFWRARASSISIATSDADFDNWFGWVNIQPTLRKIFGCSFLPDFDYGKGGRGWRDLWQDCLSLILNNPMAIRHLLVNNFSGVRIDGSNATIIGNGPGEFISDRNNLSRTWMDHGVWPLLTTDLYINETGDLSILFEEVPYFRNHEISRARARDLDWNPEYGSKLKDSSGNVYQASILEHLLVQNLVQFYNVGAHNHTQLEGADWNDGLDMAPQKGESVAFTVMYAHNLKLLAELLLKTNREKIDVLREAGILFTRFDYADRNEKIRLLDEYFASVRVEVSGEKISLEVKELSTNLAEKAEWVLAHIRSAEWLEEGFFNGYYDNFGQQVEGTKKNSVRMTLTGQVFPIMGGAATDDQVKTVFASTKKYLFDKKLGGFHLNTDFKEEYRALGRAFSFAYGEKENGAFFNHMVVMFAYALYKRGFAKEGWQVLSSIYKMVSNTDKSKVYPSLPEYFNREGRGMYSYLTGSASWFVLTLLTQTLGVRGKDGDLLIQPQLVREQFGRSSVISLERTFCGKSLCINFHNSKRIDWPDYGIQKAFFNNKEIACLNRAAVLISRHAFQELTASCENIIDIYLDR